MVGEALRLLWIFSGYKSAELAEKLGILKAMFSEIKNNKKQPTMDILDKYASVFEMKKSTLLFAEALENDVEVQNDKKQKVALAGMKLLKILERVGKFEDE